MKKLLLILPISLLLMACGGSESEENNENTENETDTTTAEVEKVEEESALTFDGVVKGDYTLYGYADIEPAGAFTAEEMMIEYQTTGEFNDKVRVTVDKVCQKAGCWMTFKDHKDKEIRVFFKDHFGIPTETPSGTEVVLFGSLVSDTLTVDFQKHLLDDAKEAGEEVKQEEYDAITEDKIELSFDAESILIKS